LRHCAKSHIPSSVKQLHPQLIKSGINDCIPLANTLLDAYGKCGLVQDAHQVFDEMPNRDHVSWASILTAHNQANLPAATLSIFPSMLSRDGLLPDHFVYATLVKACAGLRAIRQGKQVHAQFVVSRFNHDDVVKSSLVDLYAKCGLPFVARSVFDSIKVKSSISWTSVISGYARSGLKSEGMELLLSMPYRNLYSWTALISGLVQSGNTTDASLLFIEMRRDGIEIVDPLVVSTVVAACANLASLEFGKQVHGLVLALGYGSCLFIDNALVDMYAKCSDLLSARRIFDAMIWRDVVSWTSLIVGEAQHGKAMEVLDLYDQMVMSGVKPNKVTFVGLIYACSHAGLVGKGRQLFKSMVEDYGITPSLQHFTCLLDLFSRSGHLVEAENLTTTMPFEPDEPTWAALLSACKKYGNKQVGVRIANRLLSLNPQDYSSYILLSNVYAGAGLWERVSMIRKLITGLEVKKEPGYSCITLGKDRQVFYAGETFDPALKGEILNLLNELDKEMRRRGYLPDTSCVLMDMEAQEKERQLFWHSERIALAYGLLRAVPNTAIRIVKNLRVCGDCHEVFVALLRTFQPEKKLFVKQASCILRPASPQRLPLGNSEGHSLPNLIHIF
ncbi:Pentatricopeptide repeat-containing protein At4g14050, mitochondrial, partial [Linum grandiflorum]